MVIREFTGIGTRHINTAEENQDVLYHAQDNDVCVITLADGVSTCNRAKKGAEIACKAITSLLYKKSEYFLELDESKEIGKNAVSHILFKLRKQADAESRSIKDYSSTVASVLVDKRKNKLLCFNLGDSLILSTGNNRCNVLSMPADSSCGCYVTTTNDAAMYASINRIETNMTDSIVILSDGAWREIYDKNKLKSEAMTMILNKEYDTLQQFLKSREPSDDYSFISIDFRQ